MSYRNGTEGQALITVIFIAVIGMMIATGAIMTLVSSFESTSVQELDRLAIAAAESGVENSVIRLMRDPTYTGEMLQVDANSTATVTVVSNPSITITSTGVVGSVAKKIVATAHFSALALILDSWKEVP